MGLFSSGVLVCAVSIISYFHERNKSVLALYNGCFNFMNELNQNLRHNNRIAIDTVKDNFSHMMRSYDVDIYYYVCELSKIRKQSKLYKVVMNIWESSRNIYLIIMDDNNQIM